MRYIIENEIIKAEITDLGATLTRFIDKRKDLDIVLGFESDEGYLKNSGCNIGASIGRNANRIGGARFILNDKEYKLSVNDNTNQLHGGGNNGFAFKKWNVVKRRNNEIVLTYFSKDLEEGFPGNLNVTVSYKLDNNNLIFSYSGTSDKDTILNMTNHSYFNLGSETVLNDYLKIHSDKYSPTDEFGLTLDEVKEVNDSPYDFREFKRIGDNLSKLENGIDNNYVFEDLNEKLLIEYKNDKIQLNVYSDLPDMHCYTANYLECKDGKYNRDYIKYGAICFEPQYYPNGINYGDKYILPILRKGEKMSHYIKYELI